MLLYWLRLASVRPSVCLSVPLEGDRTGTSAVFLYKKTRVYVLYLALIA